DNDGVWHCLQPKVLEAALCQDPAVRGGNDDVDRRSRSALGQGSAAVMNQVSIPHASERPVTAVADATTPRPVAGGAAMVATSQLVVAIAGAAATIAVARLLGPSDMAPYALAQSL